jgi:UDP-glucuronate decarboxylase
MAKQKTILVTGGAGFVGSHLCRALLGLGHKVICLDDFSTGKAGNIRDLSSNPSFIMIEADVRKLPDDKLPEVEQIYNLACPASPKAYQSDPIKTLMTNVDGTHRVLEFALKTKAAVVQASTSEIYGSPLEHPQKESYWGNVNPVGIRSCYDEGKRAAETLCTDFAKKHKLQIKIARIFNTYGPNMDKDDGRVVSNFIVQALLGKDLTIFGDGSQTRSFQYVDDLVAGLIALMESGLLIALPLNLGNPGEFTIDQLADLVLKLLPESKSKKIRLDLPQDDPVRRCPDISQAKRILNWQPRVPLKDGLVKTINYFKTIVL